MVLSVSMFNMHKNCSSVIINFFLTIMLLNLCHTKAAIENQKFEDKIQKFCNEKIIQELKKGIFPEDPKIKKFIGCCFRIRGEQSENAEPTPGFTESFETENRKEKLTDNLRDCSHAHRDEKDYDEKAFKILRCYYNTNKYSLIN